MLPTHSRTSTLALARKEDGGAGEDLGRGLLCEEVLLLQEGLGGDVHPQEGVVEVEVSAGPSTVPGGRREGRREDSREADWRVTHRENLGRELQGELLHNCGSRACPTWPYPGCWARAGSTPCPRPPPAQLARGEAALHHLGLHVPVLPVLQHQAQPQPQSEAGHGAALQSVRGGGGLPRLLHPHGRLDAQHLVP